jgi:hypothetical protein
VTGFNEHFAAITKGILTVRVEKAQLDKGIGYTLEINCL